MTRLRELTDAAEVFKIYFFTKAFYKVSKDFTDFRKSAKLLSSNYVKMTWFHNLVCFCLWGEEFVDLWIVSLASRLIHVTLVKYTSVSASDLVV